jgi:TPR repeat protein
LADCYFNGDGMKQDYIRSAALYTKAMGKGLPQSYCALGNQYLDGLGVAKDEARAAELCRKGAELGVANAQTDLGHDVHVPAAASPKDFTESAKVVSRKAADHGPAERRLSGWDANIGTGDEGVPRDRAQGRDGFT